MTGDTTAMTLDRRAGQRSYPPYHAVLRAQHSAGLLDVVEAQLTSWLREKGLDFALEADGELVDGQRRLDVLHHQIKHGREFRARLFEATAKGTWKTELVASSRGWVDLSVVNSKGLWVDVPRLAKYLMGATELGDSVAILTERPEEWDTGDVETLCEILSHSEREGLIFVAGTSDAPADLYTPFARQLEQWMREVYGLAKVILLDPAATKEFGRLAGTHGVAAWSIRTYYPQLVLGDDQDALRHRFLTTASLAKFNEARIKRTFGVIARSHALQRDVPPEVLKSRRSFSRLENSRVLTAMAEVLEAPLTRVTIEPPSGVSGAPVKLASPHAAVLEPEAPSVESVEDYLSQVALVREILGIDVVNEVSLRAVAERRETASFDAALVDTARRRIEQLQVQVEELETARADLIDRLESVELDATIQTEQLEKASDTVRWLRSQLKRAGAYEISDSDLPADARTSYPDSLAVLVAESLPEAIVFTGDMDSVQDVVEMDTLSRCAHFAWDVILALSDYQRARQEGKSSSGVHNYLLNPPDDTYRIVPTRRHSQGETGITKRQHGGQRKFPVPDSVDPSGRKLMVAHFKLGEIGRKSPRMYYYDDAPSGVIYIGYIGVHLTNTQSN